MREVISVRRLKDAINASNEECKAIKQERRKLSRQMSLLDERARKLQRRNNDLTSFASWLNGHRRVLLDAVRIRIAQEFWGSVIDKLADIGRKEVSRQQGEQDQAASREA